MAKTTGIDGYRLVIESKNGEGGFVLLHLEDGTEVPLPSVDSYAALAALAGMLRTERQLLYDDAGRLLQNEWQPPGSTG